MEKGFYQFPRYFFLDKKVTQKIKATAAVRPTIGSFAKQKELALCAQTTFCFTLTSPCGFPAPSPMPVLTSPLERYDWFRHPQSLRFIGGYANSDLRSVALKSLKSLMSLTSCKGRTLITPSEAKRLGVEGGTSLRSLTSLMSLKSLKSLRTLLEKKELTKNIYKQN
jgi:hypothetical protein